MGNIFSRKSHKNAEKDADKKDVKRSKSKGRGDENASLSQSQPQDSTNEQLPVTSGSNGTAPLEEDSKISPPTVDPTQNDDVLVREALEEVDTALAKELNDNDKSKNVDDHDDVQEAKEVTEVSPNNTSSANDIPEMENKVSLEHKSEIIQSENEDKQETKSEVVPDVAVVKDDVALSQVDLENASTISIAGSVDDQLTEKPDPKPEETIDSSLPTETAPNSDQMENILLSTPGLPQEDNQSTISEAGSVNESECDSSGPNDANISKSAISPMPAVNESLLNEESPSDMEGFSTCSYAGSAEDQSSGKSSENRENVTSDKSDMGISNVDQMADILAEKTVRQQDDNESTISIAGSTVDSSAIVASQANLPTEYQMSVESPKTLMDFSVPEIRVCDENDEESKPSEVDSETLESTDRNMENECQDMPQNSPDVVDEPEESSVVKEISEETHQLNEVQQLSSDVIDEPSEQEKEEPSICEEKESAELDKEETLEQEVDVELCAPEIEKELKQEEISANEQDSEMPELQKESNEEEVSITNQVEEPVQNEEIISKDQNEEEDIKYDSVENGQEEFSEECDNNEPKEESQLPNNEDENSAVNPEESTEIPSQQQENQVTDDTVEPAGDNCHDSSNNEEILSENGEMQNSTTEVISNCEESAMVETAPTKLQLPVQDEMIVDEAAETGDLIVNGKSLNLENGDIPEDVNKASLLTNGDHHHSAELTNGTVAE